jgi:hypothetical protein
MALEHLERENCQCIVEESDDHAEFSEDVDDGEEEVQVLLLHH